MKFSSHILVVALVPVFALGSPANPQAGAHHSTQGLDAARNYASRLAGVRVADVARQKCARRCKKRVQKCKAKWGGAYICTERYYECMAAC